MQKTLETYPNSLSPDGSYTADEVRRGYTWLHTDVTCVHCSKTQPVAATGHLGGPCVRCGQPTLGATG